MSELIEKDEQGNWALKGVQWESLREGAVLSKDASEKLYGALWKLMMYEDTGLSPEQIYEIDECYRELAEKHAKTQEIEEVSHE